MATSAARMLLGSLFPHCPDDVFVFTEAIAQIQPHLPGLIRATLFVDLVFGPFAVAFAAAANPEGGNVDDQTKGIGDGQYPFSVGEKSVIGLGKTIVDERFLPGPVGRIGVDRKHHLNGREAVCLAGNEVLAGLG